MGKNDGICWKDWRKTINTHKSILSVLTIDSSGCFPVSSFISMRSVVSNISVGVYIMCSSRFDIINARVMCLWLLGKKKLSSGLKFFKIVTLQYALPWSAFTEGFAFVLCGPGTAERAFQKENKFSKFDFWPCVFTLQFGTRTSFTIFHHIFWFSRLHFLSIHCHKRYTHSKTDTHDLEFQPPLPHKAIHPNLCSYIFNWCDIILLK
jgi:hypothetical protein